MAGPLSGIAGQQNVPLATPLQQGQNNNASVRDRNEQQPQQNNIQPRQNAAAAETQNTATNNQDAAQAQALQQQENLNVVTVDNQADAPRGSVIDITV